jgi:dienelactone hydrolase
MLGISLTLLIAGTRAHADVPVGAMTWDPAVFLAPKTHDAPGFQAAGVKAIFYDALPVDGKPTRVFAWYGLPNVQAGKKVPGIVLVHGGGGTAFEDWVRMWTGRGYAAIAMDTCGQIPKGTNGHWQRDEQGGPVGWGGFDQIEQPLKQQWPYHAVADVILAHSLLRSMPEVDSDRIGVTGISWGGYLTCIVAGVDHRFKFAVPVYGCGFLGEDSAWLGQFSKMGPDKAGHWLALWDPSVYLKEVAIPMLWVDGTNDFAYPMDSLQKSYQLPTGSRTLCMKNRMSHGHGPGEKPEEIRAFADEIIAGGTALAKITSQGRDRKTVWATFESAAPVVAAELNFTRDLGEWQKRRWDSVAAVLDKRQKKVTGVLPEGAKVYYLNLIDERGFYVSSEHREIK